MLRKFRTVIAIVFFLSLTLLFLDFTGTIHCYLGWMAKVQLLPALLALNVAVVALLLLLTFLFGRVYCSVICPLGVMQDIFAWTSKHFKKNRYTYSPAKNKLRIAALIVFVALTLIPGASAIAHLIAPYSAYGRIAANLFAPVYLWCNNLLAYFAERAESYTFYSVDVWLKSGISIAVAAATLIGISFLAWRNGRTWCNNICPVGTALGFIAKYSLIKIHLDNEKCIKCGLCAKNCKSSCIDVKNGKIDYSRCVACYDCLDTCKKGALTYKLKPSCKKKEIENTDASRRKFIATGAILTAGITLKAQEKKMDGGLSAIQDKKIPTRSTALKPAGSLSIKHFSNHCTACQLCVSVCPNGVLRPSEKLDSLMQPEMSYERGYCRPECVRCSEVCPTGAIRRITTNEKSAVHIGYAVWIKENCLVTNDSISCGKCANVCPTGAIIMTPQNGDESTKIPCVNTERCIGCGACENMCPARPLSAIYVEGRETHIVD
ncbi:MAG: 4Fe-4S dicluster domain-containing protein [Bacteroidales bacterium]|nr:4Fe-4S dicluster domain-containing protein [Bacteroidales bacterium]